MGAALAGFVVVVAIVLVAVFFKDIKALFDKAEKGSKCENPVSQREMVRCEGGTKEKCRLLMDQSAALLVKVNELPNGEEKYNRCQAFCLAEYATNGCLCKNCPKCSEQCNMDLESFCKLFDCDRFKA